MVELGKELLGKLHRYKNEHIFNFIDALQRMRKEKYYSWTISNIPNHNYMDYSSVYISVKRDYYRLND